VTPFLVLRDDGGHRRVIELAGDRLTIGRRESADVALPWDAAVSRVHAELVRMGGDWVVCDEGLSHNGTFVNDRRVSGRRRLRDGDVLAVGDTRIEVCVPPGPPTAPRTREPAARALDVHLTPAERRVLEALCRPLRESGYAPPASNGEIAGELFLSVETVKGTLSALYERFGLAALPQGRKRAALAALALNLP
jgi:predicted component of type VI protein secretion system